MSLKASWVPWLLNEEYGNWNVITLKFLKATDKKLAYYLVYQ
jgi:hypothetical protein